MLLYRHLEQVGTLLAIKNLADDYRAGITQMAKNTGNILIVDDNEDLLLAARLFLKQHFSLVHTEQDPEKIPALLNNENYDVILLDMNFTMDATSGVEGFMWLDKILQMDPSAVMGMGCGKWTVCSIRSPDWS